MIEKEQREREKKKESHTVQQPCLRQTPRGGMSIAIIISQQISHPLAISQIFDLFFVVCFFLGSEELLYKRPESWEQKNTELETTTFES